MTWWLSPVAISRLAVHMETSHISPFHPIADPDICLNIFMYIDWDPKKRPFCDETGRQEATGMGIRRRKSWSLLRWMGRDKGSDGWATCKQPTGTAQRPYPRSHEMCALHWRAWWVIQQFLGLLLDLMLSATEMDNWHITKVACS